eukprot:365483-Chlamydomonas_euryale.AAC.5
MAVCTWWQSSHGVAHGGSRRMEWRMVAVVAWSGAWWQSSHGVAHGGSRRMGWRMVAVVAWSGAWWQSSHGSSHAVAHGGSRRMEWRGAGCGAAWQAHPAMALCGKPAT